MTTEHDTSGGAHSHASSETEERFAFRGGRLAIDFVNTVGGWRDPADPSRYAPQNENLHAYEDLVTWALAAGMVDESRAQELLREATRNQSAATAVHRRAIRLRNGLHGVLTARLHGREPAAADLDAVNAETHRVLSIARLTPSGDGFELTCSGGDDELDAPLRMVARSAIDVLTEPADLSRIRECPKVDCGWLFLDTSGGRRRWCSMADCGNAEKVKRFRTRQKRGTRTSARTEGATA